MKRNIKGYVVIFSCMEGVVRTGKREFWLSQGIYVYVGSCGINCTKRISRHLSKEVKRKRWHVDYLKEICEPEGVLVLPIPEEEIADMLSDPVKGFGSSDCRKHQGHLFKASSDLLTQLKIRDVNDVPPL
ncbi:DUF123 domain-containing protein [Metallosphaera hakonensis JCM 8857 = DSM 7519]|uniref:DUF123 domain-containing protein n=2 Tax=Metallosphaera hakonensis TaxID=79601 RepID=A0A2U9IXW4_9CREN|nr:DUF123 domain-containing protein [Metallosphaera hakonensis JCM 8857 = DSM 7519]